MGVGDPLEAPYKLSGPVPAGTYSLVGDGEILESDDMRFDVIWRPASGAGDTVLATFTHHFDVPPGATTIYDAVAFDGTATGIAAAAVAGDELVLRFTVTSQAAAGTKQYIPNGDGPNSNGRIPQLWIPIAP